MKCHLIQELETADPQLYYDILDRLYDGRTPNSQLSKPEVILRDSMAFLVMMGNYFSGLLEGCGNGHILLYCGHRALKEIGYTDMYNLTDEVVRFLEDMGVGPPLQIPDDPWADGELSMSEEQWEKYQPFIADADRRFGKMYGDPEDPFTKLIAKYVLANRKHSPNDVEVAILACHLSSRQSSRP